ENSAPPRCRERVLCRSHDLPDFLYPRRDGTERNELSSCVGSYDPGKRCLAASWRTPEYHRRKLVLFNDSPQDLARTKKIRLANKLVERCRTHSLCQRGISQVAPGLLEGPVRIREEASCQLICRHPGRIIYRSRQPDVRPMKFSTRRATSPGSSSCGTCPQSSNSSLAFARSLASLIP